MPSALRSTTDRMTDLRTNKITRGHRIAYTPESFAPSENEKSALGLPPVTKRKPELGRRRIPMINFGQRLLIVFSKFFAVWNKTPIKFEVPVLGKGAQWNAGIVLHDEAAVL